MPTLALGDGTPTGGVYGFAALALELMKKLDPDYVAVAWDKPKTNIRKRRQLYPEYKAGRKPAPADFYAQIPLLEELLEAFSWPLYELDDYEADDIMGALAQQAAKQGIDVCLITSDLDALQLVAPHVHVYALKKGFSQIEQFDVDYFTQKYGIAVEQFLDLKSLKGDSSDNIPGVPGVGEKTGIQLLQEYGTLDEVYQHLDAIKPTLRAKLEAGKDSAYLSKKIAEIWCDAPVKLDLAAMDVRDVDPTKLATLLRRLEFTSLLRRLPVYMQEIMTEDNNMGRATTRERLTEVAWPKALQLDGDKPVFLHLDDQAGELWLSLDGKSVIHHSLDDLPSSVWTALSLGTIVAYDVKATYHHFAAHGVKTKFHAVHDIRQGAFLLDPLRRDRSLGALIGDPELTTTDGNLVVAALTDEYYRQSTEFSKRPTVAEIAQNLDFPLTYQLFLMEHTGIKIDKDQLAAMSKELTDEYHELEQKMYTIAATEFNIGSPAQLSEVLFTKLQLPTTGIKKGKTGYSTGQKELDKLRGQHPIIELIERTRELAKLKNTYVDTLPKQADVNNRLHTTFNQDVAATGRLSSTNPNLQNIPVRTDLGLRIRQAFVPEDGHVFVSADYSQFELRLAAVLADDAQLINDFNGDVDIHTKTAAEVYHIPMDDVSKLQRRAAKVINFGVLYGMSPHGLAAATGMNFSEAKKFIEHYFELRAPIRAYIDATLQKAATDGFVETYYGRRRPTPDINSSNFMVREAAKRAAANMPIQGTEADLMKRAMLRVDERLGEMGKQVLQIHDSILVETPKENAKKIVEILRETMENIAPELPVKLKVDVGMGNNWSEV